jgi:ubiquinone/menaquinone biosynthesis C-methylase UbiE
MAHRHSHAEIFGLAHNPHWYARLTEPFFGRIHARIVEDVTAAVLPHDARVLDVGTGPGGVPQAIAARRPSMIIDGVDLSEEMIAHARTRPKPGKVTYTVADVAALPFPDASFDLVISSMSLHHWADVATGLREIGRVLKPGADMWIYDARLVLRRAQPQARSIFGGHSTHLIPVRTGRIPVRLIGRLRVTPQPSHAAEPLGVHHA